MPGPRKCWHLPNKLRRDYWRAAKAIHFHIHLQQTDIQFEFARQLTETSQAPDGAVQALHIKLAMGYRMPAPTAEPSPRFTISFCRDRS